MDETIRRALVEASSSSTRYRAEKPIEAALIPETIYRGAHFARIYADEFNDIWRDLAVAVAVENLGFAVKNYTILGIMKEGQLRRVQQALFAPEFDPSDRRRFLSGLENELTFIRKGRGGNLPVRVICDLYAGDRVQARRYAFVIVPPRPTWLMCKVGKEKLLKLRALHPVYVDEVYFAVPFDPEENREQYDWTLLQRWFESPNAPEVLIGEEFWDKIGGAGAYRALIEAIEESGMHSRGRIHREYYDVVAATGDLH